MKYALVFSLVLWFPFLKCDVYGQIKGTNSDELILRQLPDGTSPFTNLKEAPELVIENGSHLEYVQAVKYTTDGKEIVTASWDKTIRIWDSKTGKLIRTIRVPAYAGIEGQIYTMDVSLDKKYIAVAGSSVGETYNRRSENYIGHYVLLIDFKSGKIVDVAPNHDNSIYSVAFSPDGKKLASCAGLADNKVNVYDINPATNKLTLSESFSMTQIADSYFPACDYFLDDVCNHIVLGVRFSPDSKLVYAIDQHGMLVKITLKSGAAPSSYQLIGESPARKSGALTGRITEKAYLRSMALDPKGRYVAIGDMNGKVLVVDAKGLANPDKTITAEILLASISIPKNPFIGAMAFDPTGTLLAITVDREVRVYDTNFEGVSTPKALLKPLVTFTGHDEAVLSVAFSSDGQRVVSSGGNYNITYVWEARTGTILFQLGEGKFSPKVTRVGAHKTDPFVIGFGIEMRPDDRVNQYGTITKAFDIRNLRVIETADESDFITAQSEVEESGASTPDFETPTGEFLVSFLPLKNGHTIISSQSSLFVDNAGDLLSMTGSRTYGLAQTPDGSTFYGGQSDGSIRIFDEKTFALIATLYVSVSNEWILFTPDGYYTASKYGAKLVGWQVNDGLYVSPKFYPFEQFDLRLNRPDIVLTRIGGIPKKRIELLYLAYQKRLAKMGITEESLTGNLNAPTLTIDLALSETAQKTLTFNVKASDTQNDLDRLNVYVNDVPLYGKQGFSIKSKSSKTLEKSITLELNSGMNKVQVSVLNAAGVESDKETRYISYTGPAPKESVFVVSIGVSDYANDDYDLNYATKDANDIAAIFGTDPTKVFKITDLNAVKEKILAVKQELMKSKVDDKVILFVAGHGLLDENLDYFIGTYDVDFSAPAGRGLPYDDLENLLDGIPARKKLMFIDACHSGEVDKEDALVVASTKVPEGTVSSRGFKNITSKSESLGLENSYELMQTLFADLRLGTGAMVISSASGAEFALESDVWKNGVFTYSILEGMTNNKCDTNKDGKVQVSELRNYVLDRVVTLTDGMQHPTSRKDNMEFDFVVK